MRSVAGKKQGPVRVRYEPPTLEEAIFAAEGLTDDPVQQAEIAAGLMGLPVEEVRPQVAKLALARANAIAQTVVRSRSGVERRVVVERRGPRRAIPGVR